MEKPPSRDGGTGRRSGLKILKLTFDTHQLVHFSRMNTDVAACPAMQRINSRTELDDVCMSSGSNGGTKKDTVNCGLFVSESRSDWCREGESNPQDAKHRQILSLLCLPVPPPRHGPDCINLSPASSSVPRRRKHPRPDQPWGERSAAMS